MRDTFGWLVILEVKTNTKVGVIKSVTKSVNIFGRLILEIIKQKLMCTLFKVYLLSMLCDVCTSKWRYEMAVFDYFLLLFMQAC